MIWKFEKFKMQWKETVNPNTQVKCLARIGYQEF